MHHVPAYTAELKVTAILSPLCLPSLFFRFFFPTMRHSSLHNYKHFVYADYCVIKKDILLAVASQRKLQGRTAD